MPRARHKVIVRSDSRKSQRTIVLLGPVTNWQLAKELVTCRARSTKNLPSNKSVRDSTPTSSDSPSSKPASRPRWMLRIILDVVARSAACHLQPHGTATRYRLRRRQLHVACLESNFSAELCPGGSQPTHARSRKGASNRRDIRQRANYPVGHAIADISMPNPSTSSSPARSFTTCEKTPNGSHCSPTFTIGSAPAAHCSLPTSSRMTTLAFSLSWSHDTPSTWNRLAAAEYCDKVLGLQRPGRLAALGEVSVRPACQSRLHRIRRSPQERPVRRVLRQEAK